MVLAATGGDRLDPSLANLLAVVVMVVAAIGAERIRTPTSTTRVLTDER